jgi:hypothetical protein
VSLNACPARSFAEPSWYMVFVPVDLFERIRDHPANPCAALFDDSTSLNRSSDQKPESQFEDYPVRFTAVGPYCVLRWQLLR